MNSRDILTTSTQQHNRVGEEILNTLIILSGGAITTLITFVGSRKDMHSDGAGYASICFLIAIVALVSSKWARSLYRRKSAFDSFMASEQKALQYERRQHVTWDGLMHAMDKAINRARKDKWVYTYPINTLVVVGCLMMGVGCGSAVMFFLGVL